jgi:pilus assembly protein CpaD
MNRHSASIATALFAAASLSACAGAGGHEPQPITPTERYHMAVEAQPEQVAFRVHPEGLSLTQADALARYAKGWSDNSGGPISVSAPENGGEAAKREAWAIKARLEALGVGSGDVSVGPYHADADGAPVLIVYDRYEAKAQHCNRSWTNLADNHENAGQKNFGCAVTANMAAQLANPRDAVAPQPMTGTDAGRREMVMEKYRAGAVTSATPDANASAKIAQVD